MTILSALAEPMFAKKNKLTIKGKGDVFIFIYQELGRIIISSALLIYYTASFTTSDVGASLTAL
jgi:hypothetical protein